MTIKEWEGREEPLQMEKFKEHSNQLNVQILFGSLFEQTSCKDTSLKQLRNNEYRDYIRYYQRMTVNFVRYDNKIMVL